jgi:predicted nucleotidyltransferase component of viral defense system
VIHRLEILEFAREVGLSPEIVEKDYVLGWLLGGISNHPALRSTWLFKGGTCLKKCYFETYRFSEDLDFTLNIPGHLTQEFLGRTFLEVADWIYERCGIEMPSDTITFDIYANPRGKLSVQGRIGYRGPLQRRGSTPRIKLDLTDDERIVLDPVWREVHHPYSDRPGDGIQALCYSYEELFAEKIRALAERMRPRDLYDVIHLYRHDDAGCDRELVRQTLRQKCDFKGIPVPNADSLARSPERAELESEWENMLGHQLPEVPPLAHFFEELPRLFSWLTGLVPRAILPFFPAGADEDPSWRPPAMVSSWRTAAPLETIRFSAANRLCVDLSYQGTHRLIEPYSLRRTRDGNVILHAIRHDGGDHRSYRVDRIEGASATRTSFMPRYLIELSPSGPLSIPQTAAQPLAPRTSSISAGLRRPVSSGSIGPIFVIQCTHCGRQFRRKSYDTALNPHKGTAGYSCPGRTGFLVETKY